MVISVLDSTKPNSIAVTLLVLKLARHAVNEIMDLKKIISAF